MSICLGLCGHRRRSESTSLRCPSLKRTLVPDKEEKGPGRTRPNRRELGTPLPSVPVPSPGPHRRHKPGAQLYQFGMTRQYHGRVVEQQARVQAYEIEWISYSGDVFQASVRLGS
jgi:hypothetical protein